MGCNFGVTLMVSQDCPPNRDAEWSSVELVPRIGQELADLLGQRVYYHRTWLGVGESLVRKRAFHPSARRTERRT